MGEKRIRCRQCLLFYVAFGVIIILVFNGCATIKKYRCKREADHSLDRAWELMEDGNSAQAIREQEKILALFPKHPPGDRALYEKGLFLVAPQNKNRDYGKSFESFQKLIRTFPESRYRQNAEIWSSVLSETIELRNRDAECNTEIKVLQDRLLLKEKEINNLMDQQKKMKQIDLELNKKREMPSGGAE